MKLLSHTPLLLYTDVLISIAYYILGGMKHILVNMPAGIYRENFSLMFILH